MSDFTSSFWPIFIIAISLGGIFGCCFMLWVAAKVKVPVAGSGHVWDEDLHEMNNPLPRWWVGMFILTVIFALLYLAVYPGLGTYAGKLNWTSKNQYEKEVATANEALKPMYAKFAAMSTEDLAKNPEARGIGERLFMNNCAQCHGSDAKGSRGFPNLTDNDWIHGGSPEKIQQTITDGRIGMMPPMAAAVGNAEDVKNVANYVLSLSGSMFDSGRAGLGKEKFVACLECHFPGKKSQQKKQEPKSYDKIWV